MFNNYTITYWTHKIRNICWPTCQKINTVESPFKASFEVVDLNMVRKDLNGGYVTMKLLNWKHRDRMLNDGKP